MKDICLEHSSLQVRVAPLAYHTKYAEESFCDRNTNEIPVSPGFLDGFVAEIYDIIHIFPIKVLHNQKNVKNLFPFLDNPNNNR